jgi:hypothetical protein
VFRVLENEHAVVTHPLVNGVLRVATVCLGSGILFALSSPLSFDDFAHLVAEHDVAVLDAITRE